MSPLPLRGPPPAAVSEADHDTASAGSPAAQAEQVAQFIRERERNNGQDPTMQTREQFRAAFMENRGIDSRSHRLEKLPWGRLERARERGWRCA